MSHLSFGAQALRYFQREHEEVLRQPLASRAAWRGDDLARRRDWIVELSAPQIEELDAALAHARAVGKPLEQIGRDDFPLPALGAAARAWAREIDSGRGFLLVRGLPVERWGDESASIVFWSLGQYLGTPGAQNPDGDLLGHVIDTGEEASNPSVRRYRTAGDIRYHCDLADVVGLLCLRAARSGGASRIASSVTVYNEILRRRPDLVERLYEPFNLDARNEEGPERPPYIPVPPCRYAEGKLKTFYHSDYFRSAVRHPGVVLSPQEQELLDLYEEIATSPGVYLDMQFQPGDMQLLSNHFIVHARTAYADESASKRHLLRLWLSLNA